MFKTFLVAYTFLALVVVSAQLKDADFLPVSISELKQYYKFIDILEKRTVLNKQQADTERENCFQHAKKLAKEEQNFTLDKFLTWDQRQSIISFSNLLAILAGITVVIALASLSFIFIIPLITHIRIEVWETILYIVSISMMLIMKNDWLIFLGCLIFFGALLFTQSIHFARRRDFGLKMSWILITVWGTTAILKQSFEAAYLATFALESALGFVIIKRSLVTAIGFESEDKVPVATTASLVLILLGTFLHLQAKLNTPLNVFTRPFLFMGTFVYSIGMIIMSSTFYTTRKNRIFWLLQLVTFISGLAALLFGPLLSIPFLQSVGGTMLVLWLMEKYVEIVPWKRSSVVAFNLLIFGVILYCIALFFKKYPGYLIFSDILKKSEEP